MIMKKVSFLLGCLAMLFASACSSDTPEVREDVIKKTGLEGARERLLKIIADPAFRKMRADEDNPLGLAKVAQGSAYDCRGQELTRASEDSAMYYIFRFDNGGYAVVGAKEYMPDLLVYSPFGPVGGGDTIPYIPPISREDDPIWYGDGSKVYGETRYEWQTSPNYIDIQWGQSDPYNMYVGGGSTVTGCLPTAMAIFMASEKYRPTYYAGHTFNWNTMLTFKNRNFYTDLFLKDEAIRQIARLMECLGRSNNLAATYGEKTGCSPTHISRTFGNFNFSNVGTTQSYNTAALKNELIQGYPVLMWGTDAQENVSHAWVCSGLCKMIKPWATYTSSPTPDTQGEDIYYLYYFNAGWDGFKDGLYLEQVFDFDKGPEFVSRRKEGNNYNVNVSMHLGVRK